MIHNIFQFQQCETKTSWDRVFLHLYTDDVVRICDTKQEPQTILNLLQECCYNSRICINNSKSQVIQKFYLEMNVNHVQISISNSGMRI
jgi:hypothetical protein